MFFKNKNDDQNKEFAKIAALLIHAARIDQDFSSKEEEIIKKTLIEIGVKNEHLVKVIEDAKKIEEDSNQILNFTKEVKRTNEKDKIKIIKALWRIIYSNKDADIYDMNLMRRLAGLLYIDSKIMGDIKEEIKKEFL